ncbi:hypothetical protein BGZ63DRAFT_429170 [Mariannaea sp. PMI_226]|nr:hypothetical protein BGZ63DRAFT_429170 [Mariannaea sp. PMI_226]
MAVWKHSLWQKDRLRKRTKTAKPRTVKLGKDCETFAFLAYYDITHKRLDGDIWVPKGETIPDVQAFAQKLLLAKQAPQREQLQAPQRGQLQVPQREQLRRSPRTRKQAAAETAVRQANQRRLRSQDRAKETPSILPEITVADSDTESVHENNQVSSIPATPAPDRSRAERAPCERPMHPMQQPANAPQNQPRQCEQADYSACRTEGGLANAQQSGITSEDAEGEIQHEVVSHDGLPNGNYHNQGNHFRGASTESSTVFPNNIWIPMPTADASNFNSMDVNFGNVDLGDMDLNFDSLDLVSPPPSYQVAETATMVSTSESMNIHPVTVSITEQRAEAVAEEASHATAVDRGVLVMPHPQSPPCLPSGSQPSQRPEKQTATKKTKVTRAECLLRLRVIRDATAQILSSSRLHKGRGLTTTGLGRMPRASRGMQALPTPVAAY